ncbi:MAG: AprI/Inh family metalloprotease inhibitor, partial [Proteobacteria bacterium]|nr:AprI/Inh family metalloprotease inhibitor [Pseudomonadota bacterium]
MKTLILLAGLATAGLAPVSALAADSEAGVPLAPNEAAGAWTISSEGQDLCTLTLSAGHGVKSPATCNTVLPGAPASWRATADGMELMGADGKPVMAF